MRNATLSIASDSSSALPEKFEGEMLQLELYVNDLLKACNVFKTIFGMQVIEEKTGWRQLRHVSNFDIMLIAPEPSSNANENGTVPDPGMGGKGIEIVICTTEISNKLKEVEKLGYQSTGLRYPSWGGLEFAFRLDEGYFIRVKQASKRSNPSQGLA